MKIFYVFTFVFFGMSAMAQNADSTAVKTEPFKISDSQTFGIELDMVPYFTGGYHVSLWYGKDHLRYRGVYSFTNVSVWATPNGFKDHQLWKVAFEVDYFFKENFEGWWIDAGYQYWNSQIQDEEATQKLFYTNNVMTFGAGYVWKFASNFYLNPGASANILITNLGPFQLGGKTYTPSIITPEISLKLGWHL